MLKKFQFQIEETIYKNRLDKFLFDEITSLSRMYLKHLILDGNCTVNGKIENGGYHLKSSDFVEIEIDIKAEIEMIPENIPLEIVFEDSELIVLNKPSGMLVHPTKGVRRGTLLNALLFHLNSDEHGEIKNGKLIRAGLVHRLDKQTSGLMVIAKNPRSHRILCSHFQRRLVEKKYLAVVEGIVGEDCGTINAPIGRNAEERFWHISLDGKSAESRFRVVKRFSDKTLLELEPVTGRTNQLRLHCAHIGHPIIGDDKYGGRDFQRLCLHAAKLAFWHPNGSNRLMFESLLFQ
ncbi:RluA family pseudouridine synthase [soil metagenome]